MHVETCKKQKLNNVDFDINFNADFNINVNR